MSDECNVEAKTPETIGEIRERIVRGISESVGLRLAGRTAAGVLYGESWGNETDDDICFLLAERLRLMDELEARDNCIAPEDPRPIQMPTIVFNAPGLYTLSIVRDDDQ